MPKLIIVESPHKAKTISGILGSGYAVRASAGHIRDLDKKSVSIDLENLTPIYSNIPDKEALIKSLKSATKSASEVIIASDPDREGEAIAYHLEQALGLNGNYKRAEFHEITEKGVRDGLAHTRIIDKKLVAAQEARRVIDRLIGYGLSPKLSGHIKEAKSAGRVQTAALRIIVEREEQIVSFEPQNKYRVELACSQGDSTFTAFVARKKEESKNTLMELSDEAIAKKIASELYGKPANITDITTKPIKRNPPPPFTTSSFQQACNSFLGIAPEEAMRIAQRLYEAGHITYMRTDSLRLADDAVSMAKGFIIKQFGNKYFENHVYKNKDGSQDAHEAIRPSSLSSLSLSGQDGEVYELIKNRFLASQMSAALYDQTIITVAAGGYIALFKGSVPSFDGYKKLYGYGEEKEKAIPPVRKGTVAVSEINIKNWLTEPASRFTESSIIKELEDKGIGRPSTYAATVKKLKDREYIKLDKKKIIPTELGKNALKFLLNDYDLLFDIKYTAEIESKLDLIAQGKAAYKPVVRELYSYLLNKNVGFSEKGIPFAPSSGQIDLAEKLSVEYELQLPGDYRLNGPAIKEFIGNALKIAKKEKGKNPRSSYKPSPPSQKQFAYAESIAKKKGIKLPAGCKTDWSVCGEFINKNK